MDEQFQPGDIVDIVIDSARVVSVRRIDTLLEFEGPDGTVGLVSANHPAVNIVRVGPVGWPPQPEDLWRRDDGTLYFGTARGSNTVLVDRHDDDLEPQEAYEIRHRLTLVRREQQDGGGGRG